MSDDQLLKKAIEAYHALELASQHLDKLTIRLTEAYRELNRLEQFLNKQYKDIRKIEKLGVRKLFFKILGSQEEQIEIEKQEYLQIALNFNELTKSIELMEFEKGVLQEKLKTKNAIELELKNQIEIREHQLLNYPNSLQAILKSINRDIDAKIGLKREIYEAKIVGTKLNRVLEKMIANLEDTQGWGEWDQWADPDKVEHHGHMQMKKESIDKAQNLSYHAKQLLQEFEDELKDIYADRRIAISYLLKDFSHFNNQYANDLLSDWVIHQKVNNVLSNVKSVRDQVRRLIASIDHEMKQADQSILYLETRKKELILEKSSK